MAYNFLVTGGAGFIGSNLVEALLDRGESVRVVDNFSTGKRENIEAFVGRTELIEGSLIEMEICRRAVEDIDFILHEAALPSVERSVADPVASNDANVSATVRLLTAAKQARVRRFVYAASSSAYGDIEAPVKSEDIAPQPKSPYAAAKLAGEYYCKVFHEVYGLETIALRYFNIFGPNQDPSSPYSAVIPIFITAALDGRRPTIFGDGRQSRDFTYVANVVQANLLACQAADRAAGEVINVACGERIDLLGVLDAIGHIIGRRTEPQFEAPRPGDVRHSLADLTKASELLGYRPIVPFAKGLELTIEWYRSHRNRW
ncbi:SDR family oxidoreductase [Candidatus Sumerlaeota bacterium]|nr:SDR family oxidoreductase [Candidatus Sumerlaeota bacterium]